MQSLYYPKKKNIRRCVVRVVVFTTTERSVIERVMSWERVWEGLGEFVSLRGEGPWSRNENRNIKKQRVVFHKISRWVYEFVRFVIAKRPAYWRRRLLKDHYKIYTHTMHICISKKKPNWTNESSSSGQQSSSINESCLRVLELTASIRHSPTSSLRCYFARGEVWNGSVVAAAAKRFDSLDLDLRDEVYDVITPHHYNTKIRHIFEQVHWVLLLSWSGVGWGRKKEWHKLECDNAMRKSNEKHSKWQQKHNAKFSENTRTLGLLPIHNTRTVKVNV